MQPEYFTISKEEVSEISAIAKRVVEKYPKLFSSNVVSEVATNAKINGKRYINNK